MTDILAIDVGTTRFKMGVFGPDLSLRAETGWDYAIRLEGMQADIDPQCWWEALRACAARLRPDFHEVGAISLSVTTPGLTAMDADGQALSPAILFLDGRSRQQALEIREKVGEGHFLEATCNLPVSGGSSLCSILWLRQNLPQVWRSAAKFGHCNTYMVRRLTGEWAIDPSTTSITGLYNTARDDLTWNEAVLEAAEIPAERLPRLMRSHAPAGGLLPGIAAELGLQAGIPVLTGGNDAVLAAFSGGLVSPGQVSQVHGTCDITSVCVDRPLASADFNLRCHVLPGRWLTFFVLNTGGKALEWFQAIFCRELSPQAFYQEYLPGVLGEFLNDPRAEEIEAGLPAYVPYLQGSRYSTEALTASFSNLSLATRREHLLLALLKGNLAYSAGHLAQVSRLTPVEQVVHVTGGEARIPGFLAAKRRWTGLYELRYQDQSSLRGSAMLGAWHLNGRPPTPAKADL